MTRRRKGQGKIVFLSAVLVAALILGMILFSPAQAQGPEGRQIGIQAALGTAFTYQGRLFNGGSPANGTYDFEFRLYDAASGGAQVGPTVTKTGVAVSDGYFTVQLDFGNVFNGSALWLQVSVRPSGSGSYTSLGRQALTAAPFASYAGQAGQAASVPWSGLTGVPAGFADNTDDDTLAGLSCASGQVAKWNGSAWACANDDTGGGGGAAWALTGNAGTDWTLHFLGTTDSMTLTIGVNSTPALLIAPAANPNYGGINLIGGFFSQVTTDVVGATIAGGGVVSGGIIYYNQVTDNFGTVGGGFDNMAGNNAGTIFDAEGATVAGGISNTAAGANSTIGGGTQNWASGSSSVVAGGKGNTAAGANSTIGGGTGNQTSGSASVVAGGEANQATADRSTVGGGWSNRATQAGATVSGGSFNRASGDHATVGGGGGFVFPSGAIGNEASGNWATIAGGSSNVAAGHHGSIGGGAANIITSTGSYGTIAGGQGNDVRISYGSIGGGGQNQVYTGTYGTIAGGSYNVITGSAAYGSIGGGSRNTVSGYGATVGGGLYNQATGTFATVAGGGGWFLIPLSNKAQGNWSTVGGGAVNQAQGYASTVGGGMNNQAVLTYTTVSGGRYNVANGEGATVGGGTNNTASAQGATIAGGEKISVQDKWATVGGGRYITVTSAYAFVGGGTQNEASGTAATIGGGQKNIASGLNSAILGGYGNEASAWGSVAMGSYAHARSLGAAVWNLTYISGPDVYSGKSQAFFLNAPGGIWFGNYSGASPITPTIAAGVFLSTTTGAHLTTGGTWTNASDRNKKENFAPIDPMAVLEKVANLPVQTWNYKTEDPSIRHMGPTAQDFYAAFGLGADDKHISTVDAAGVALAAIQGLYQQNQAQAEQIRALEEENAQLKARVDELEARIEALEAGGPLSQGGMLPGAGALILAAVWVWRERRKGGA